MASDAWALSTDAWAEAMLAARESADWVLEVPPDPDPDPDPDPVDPVEVDDRVEPVDGVAEDVVRDEPLEDPDPLVVVEDVPEPVLLPDVPEPVGEDFGVVDAGVVALGAVEVGVVWPVDFVGV